MRKKLSAILATLSLVSLLGACPPPDPNNPAAKYQGAKTTITIARAVVKGGYTTFLGVEAAHRQDCNKQVCKKLHPDPNSQAYKDCMAQDHSAVAEWKTCYGKMGDAKSIIDKAVPIADSVLDETDAAIDFAIAYEMAKAQKEAAKDPKKLQEFCDSAFPAKAGQDYQDCLAGKPLKKADWKPLLQKGSCVVYNALAFVPSEYAKYVEPVRIWFKGYGSCK